MRLRLYHIMGLCLLLLWVFVALLLLWVMHGEVSNSLSIILFFCMLFVTAPILHLARVSLIHAGKRKIKEHYLISYSYLGKEIYRIDMRKVVYAIEVRMTRRSSYIVISNEKIVPSESTTVFEKFNIKRTIALEGDTYFKCVAPHLQEVIYVENYRDPFLGESLYNKK